MKKFLFFLSILLVIFLYQPLKFNGLASQESNFTITLIKGDKQEIRIVPAFSVLSEILSDRDLEGIDLKKINLNRIVNHNDLVVLPLISETECVSINNSSLEQLITLSGVGTQTALRIIEYRDNTHSFSKLEDIKLVKGIKDKLFEKIREYICL